MISVEVKFPGAIKIICIFLLAGYIDDGLVSDDRYPLEELYCP